MYIRHILGLFSNYIMILIRLPLGEGINPPFKKWEPIPPSETRSHHLGALPGTTAARVDRVDLHLPVEIVCFVMGKCSNFLKNLA